MSKYKTLKEQVHSRYENEWTALAGRWSDGMKRRDRRAGRR